MARLHLGRKNDAKIKAARTVPDAPAKLPNLTAIGTTTITKSNGKIASSKLVLSDITINSSADIAQTNAPIEEYTHRVIAMFALIGVRCVVDVASFLFNCTSDLGLSIPESIQCAYSNVPLYAAILSPIRILAAYTVTLY